MSDNSRLETEDVIKGLVTPSRIPEMGRAKNVVLLTTPVEFQQIPDDQIEDDDLLKSFLFKTSLPLPENPHIGPKISSMIRKFRDLGEILGTEMSTAITVDKSGKLWEASVTDISGGSLTAKSWSNTWNIPEGHELLVQIHNHPKNNARRLTGVEGFTIGINRSDLDPQIRKEIEQRPPKLNIVVTPKGSYFAIRKDDRLNGKPILFRLLTEFLANPLQNLYFRSGIAERFLRKYTRSLLMKVLGNGYKTKISQGVVSDKERLELQKAVCRKYGLALYFVGNDTTEAKKIS